VKKFSLYKPGRRAMGYTREVRAKVMIRGFVAQSSLKMDSTLIRKKAFVNLTVHSARFKKYS